MKELEKVSMSRIETALFRIDRATSDPEVKKLVEQALQVVKEERDRVENIREVAFMIANKL
ncbi:hypothetical protein GZH47_33550 (plasmid) [Paenibacillus rhizovicinus]|uniref:Uncharacterized protein n=1 Tax=Paenibacillus rhizovicinus TaxID=2704463 RepID=A0A6C0PB57_9BACL|nr:hypothetical protein [Paenibacillus rhizovicinus]QHW35820.1 hypothetical protein GZH47_33550 [Paenibacillus rhizovicinus]